MRLTVRRIWEVNTIPDIRERSNRPKDKQPKHQTASTVQRQMVQKFVKELNDSTKQSDRSDSAERTATEQVEMTAREIVHEAVQLPRRAIQYSTRRRSEDSSASVQPERSDQPRHAPELPRERTDAPRTRPDATLPQSTPASTPQEQARRAYVQQATKEVVSASSITPEPPRECHVAPSAPLTENMPRQRTNDIRTRTEAKQPQSVSMPTPQEQGRLAYVRRAKKSRAKKRLRWIIFIRSSRKSGLRIVLRRKKFRRFVKSRKHRKSAIKYIPKPHQQNRPLFVM